LRSVYSKICLCIFILSIFHVNSSHSNFVEAQPEQELLKNGDFETGYLSGWIVEGSAESTEGYSWGVLHATAESLSGYWFLALAIEEHTGSIHQTVQIPADATKANISFWYACAPTTGSKLGFYISNDEGEKIEAENFTLRSGWKQFILDIDSDYFGENLTIGFWGQNIINYQTQGITRYKHLCFPILDDVSLKHDGTSETVTSSITPTNPPSTVPSSPEPQPSMPEETTETPYQHSTTASSQLIPSTGFEQLFTPILLVAVITVIIAVVLLRKKSITRR